MPTLQGFTSLELTHAERKQLLKAFENAYSKVFSDNPELAIHYIPMEYSTAGNGIHFIVLNPETITIDEKRALSREFNKVIVDLLSYKDDAREIILFWPTAESDISRTSGGAA